MATIELSVSEVCAGARRASRQLASLGAAVKREALEAIADALIARTGEIVEANARDLEAGREAGLSAALLDRLALDAGRIDAIAEAARRIAALPDPVGELIDGWRLDNGLEVRKVRVPLGVVAVVYEARPNVTIDSAALCLKSGNAIVLRGSSTAAASNAVLAQIAIEAATGAGIPKGAINLIAGGGREELAELATQEGVVDLIIPRGGEGLKAALKGVATVPVIYAASGNCHVYVDGSADLEMARAIVLNAKLQSPGVCNAAETQLVHRDLADEFLPGVLGDLVAGGVTLHAGPEVRELAERGGISADAVVEAGERDWAEEYLSLDIAVGVVDSVEAAIEHVNRYGSGHSEVIVTGSLAAAQSFTAGVDAACVYVNASSRFTDGGEFGMGAEIGNSTQKLHARGPIGLRELCSFKYVIEGSGQVRA